MTKTILEILLKGMGIFSEERKRHFSKELTEKYEEVKLQENARFPDYNDDKIALAQEDLDTFLLAYGEEFSKEVDKLEVPSV